MFAYTIFSRFLNHINKKKNDICCRFFFLILKSNYSIIISIYNEKASIPSLLEHLYFYYTKGHEIIIIDDGSNDGSNKILCKSNFVNFIKFKHNKGKGIAIKEGIQKATNEKIIIFDGDLEINPDQIQELMILDHKKKIRCVLANRFKWEKTISIWNIGNKVLTFIFNYLHSSDVKDALCCAKAFFKSDIDLKNLKSKKFDIDVELLSILVKSNPKIKNINIIYERRNINQGKKLKLSDSFRIIYRIIFS